MYDTLPVVTLQREKLCRLYLDKQQNNSESGGNLRKRNIRNSRIVHLDYLNRVKHKEANIDQPNARYQKVN